jgi:hypothetical protein
VQELAMLNPRLATAKTLRSLVEYTVVAHNYYAAGKGLCQAQLLTSC